MGKPPPKKKTKKNKTMYPRPCAPHWSVVFVFFGFPFCIFLGIAVDWQRSADKAFFLVHFPGDSNRLTGTADIQQTCRKYAKSGKFAHAGGSLFCCFMASAVPHPTVTARMLLCSLQHTKLHV